MEKAYNPENFESNLYQWWEKNGYFKADDHSTKPSFVIQMPPPNVTGALHNGHALFVTIQDALTRWKRMKGFNALWLPGTDHAGIATQMVVEREISKEPALDGSKKGLTRHQLGRQKFIERIWSWKEKHGNIITQQMRKLGGSPDWSRERFTMDEGLSHSVREAFVRFYEEGLLYRGKRLINWCTRCQTALSDLEVKPVDKKGHFWHIKYISENSKDTLIIATTRPETLLGDSAVAVHPEDERYKHLIGKKVKLPMMNRLIPVIADSYVDKEFGSGALKVTPAHDFNDYEIGTRHSLEMISVFDKSGKINENGAQYQGLLINEARDKIVADLTEQGLLDHIEDHSHSVGVCDRCERVVEPMISEQWFLNVKQMADQAIEAVKKGEKMTLAEVDAREDAIKIVPELWNATFYQWMENIRDWCVSRQLWWGHQIPAWYCMDCAKTTVSRVDIKNCSHCQSHTIEQDPDVLDTWFSSGLWTFSTLGWPQNSQALKKFYPSSVMETGFDILFFWVARMIMMGMHFNDGRVPFKRVYLHAMVRDEKGQKMSKTKGNVIDPLDIISEYGADAFRFTLSIMAGQGRDVKLSLDRIDGYKAFCNKLWNASRYVLLRLGHLHMDGMPTYTKTEFSKITENLDLQSWLKNNFKSLHPVNQWILTRFDCAIEVVESGLENFKLNESSNELYSFIWNEYCDWYIEFSKVLLENPKTTNETQICLMYLLQEILKLAHPFIPFITEEIYQNLPDRPSVHKGESIMISQYPSKLNMKMTSDADGFVQTARTSIEAIRAFRGENNIHPKARPELTYEKIGVQCDEKWMEQATSIICVLSQIQSLKKENGDIKGSDTSAEIITSHFKFYVPMKGLIDVAEELKRVEKQVADVKKDIEHVKNKLSKETFISKAPADLVAAEKQKIEQFNIKLIELEKTRSKLSKLK